METRTVVTETRPAQPAREVTAIRVTYVCDQCGQPMPEYNSYGGFYEQENEGKIPRNRVRVFLEREHAPGDTDSDEQLTRDYCDQCLLPIWQAITAILAYPADTEEPA